MAEPESGPDPPASWDDQVAAVEAIAAEYRDDDWATMVLHPEAVHVEAGADAEEPGFVVVVPGDEYEELLETVEGGVSLAEFRVDQRTAGDYAVFLLALEGAEGDAVVLFPLYYPLFDDTPDRVSDRIDDEGPIYVRLARHDGAYLRIPITDADLLAPPVGG